MQNLVFSCSVKFGFSVQCWMCCFTPAWRSPAWTLTHLHSRSVLAGKWWWSVTAGIRDWGRTGTVAPTVKREPFPITGGWKAEAAWWDPPGTSGHDTAASTEQLCDVSYRLCFSVCSHSSSGLNRIVQITSNSIPSSGNTGGFKSYKGTPRQF